MVAIDIEIKPLKNNFFHASLKGHFICPFVYMICILCKKNTSRILTKELRAGEKRLVFYCPKCDLGMLDNAISEKELKDYYKKSYRKISSHKLNLGASPQELFDGAVMFQGDRLNILKKYFGKNKRLLEVGCSSGMFLWHARNHVKEAIGIDYDTRSAKFAAKKCRCKTYDTDIEQTELKEKSFDIICAFQTLEHVSDPIGFISKYKKYLKPGGVMAIEVPNIRDSLLYAYDIPTHVKFYFHAAHLWYFSPRSLDKIMRKEGFRGKVLGLQDYNIINHMHWLITGGPQRTNMPGLGKPVLPVRAGIEPKIKNILNTFIQETDLSYKKKLADLQITSNIFYLGKK